MTDGRPKRSHRYNEIYATIGMDAELRSVFAVGGSCWGVVNLVRAQGQPDFSDADLCFIDDAAAVIASKLRRSSIVSAPPTGLDRVDPGVVIFDQEGSVVSMTEAARQSLDLFATNQLLDVDGVSLPPEAYIVAARARAQACGRIGPDPIARASAGGVRLTIRASCTHAPDGSLGETVLVIEPARSRDLLPLIVDAFELSQREEEVVARVLAGDSAKQIASRLFISVHTVRDHIKSIYEKTGVGSRPELTRLLIDTHYLPIADTRHGRP